MGNEVNIFLTVFILGILMGISYDIIRIFRYAIYHSKFTKNLEDGIYWVLVLYSTYNILLFHNNGEMRYYLILGIFLGWFIYFITISKIIMSISHLIINFVRKIVFLFIEIVLTPFKLLYIVFKKPLINFARFLNKKFIKQLQFYKFYVKINKMNITRNNKIFKNLRKFRKGGGYGNTKKNGNK